MSRSFSGIITPNLVPLDDDGAINEAEYRRYIDWLIDSGVHGIYPNGSTGEFTRFTPEERRRIIQITCDQVGDRIPVLAGAAEANVCESIAACSAYLEYGATAVAIVSPYYYKLGQEAIFAYYRDIARESPIDVMLYNIPLFANPIEADTVRRLSEIERIIGIKDSSGDISHMLRMMAAIEPDRPDFIFLTGWDAAIVPMLIMGCAGGINATSGIVPEVTRRIYDLTRAGDIGPARKLQMQLIEAFDAMIYGADFPEGFRTAVDLRGFQFGRSRQPVGNARPIDRDSIQRHIDQLLGAVGATADV